MEENSENASPYGGTSLANGSSSSGDVQSGSSSSNTSNGMTAAGANTMANGNYSTQGARPNGVSSQANGTAVAATSTTPSAAGAGGAATPATNGTGANTTIGGKAFNTAKRSRLVGVPPPVYSPLGASSPSMSSNAPSFSNSSGTGSSSTSSSATVTPSASPQASNAPLPNTLSSYTAPPPQHQQQQQSYGSLNAGAATGGGQQHIYPALHLHPLNDTFIPKQISLYPPGPNNRIKIGRQTNAKTVPAPNNGYFDSKVLSRMHAEVWAEGSKVYIKDVKSSNGTFINGERLSPEAVESDIFELHNNDMVEFGIDITSEDAKTIVHHKVAARCFLVMNADDAAAASRNFANYYRDLGDSPMHRRPNMGQGKGGMASSGMNIDQVLSRLQSELQKSRETGADLGTLTSNLGEIHETLGGNLPVPPVPAYRVPPYVPGSANAAAQQQQQQQAAQQSQAQTQQLLTSLQAQLQETQNALSGHVDRIRNLEGLLDEQERMRTELKEVKDRMEEARSEWERLREDREQANLDLSDDEGDSDKEDLQEEEAEDDGPRTIRLDEDDLSDLANHAPVQDGSGDFHHRSQENAAKLNKPVEASSSASSDVIVATQARLEAENTALSQRMEALSNELSAASQLSSSLKLQYTEAAETIRGLEEKVNTLERVLHSQRSQPNGVEPASKQSEVVMEGDKSNRRDDILREVENRFINWKKSFEEAVEKERQGWEQEREQLRITLSEWEKRSESLKQSQAASSSTSGARRKRRSKASTVSTSSEESSDSQDDSQEEGGFVSPVTEEEAQGSAQDSADAYPKRPRSRRRNHRGGDSSRSTRRVLADSEGSKPHSLPTAKAVEEAAGQALRRRRSWIPFSQSFYDGGLHDEPAKSGDKASTAKKRERGREATTVLEHAAIPIVSAAGVLVIGYIAYTVIIQHQK